MKSAALPQQQPATSRADEAQREAADPQSSVWVGASAGSGKTKVLTDRVLRLLLPRDDGAPGTAPHRILCLTFTKSAAGEMALRLSSRLSQWAVMEETKLAAELAKLTGRTPDAPDIAAARRLFAAVTDAPGGLNILTIHAFCQSVLGRFPLEAGLPPYFEPLEEDAAATLLDRARAETMAVARREPGSRLGEALRRVAATAAEDGADRLIRDTIGESAQFRMLLKRHGGMDGLMDAARGVLGLKPGDTDESILRTACEQHMYDEHGLRECCRAMAEHGTASTDHPAADNIQAWLDAPAARRVTSWNEYKVAFLTKDGEARKKFPTKKPCDAFPDIVHIIGSETARILEIEDRCQAARCIALTQSLLRLGEAILSRYEELKAACAGLDFDDLISRTLALLERRDMGDWVMFKLDGGIDHILIDEAQDTNPEQWRIVAALCDDFFSGAGARGDDIRTVFAVGDEKQSIYSFQRAAPEKFRDMRAFFSERVTTAGRRMAQVDMNVSFRSVPAVLDAVDATFDADDVRAGLGPLKLKHASHRAQSGHGGHVELWPLFTTPERQERDPWEPPVTIRQAQGGGARLAEYIGETICGWLADGEILESRGRAIQPGDIMILVRRRSAFVGQLIRALKTRGIPVGGADRMVLKEQLVVQDLVAAVQFALLPSDDLSLACLLKSPFIGWDDARLEEIAAERGQQTLWEALKLSNSDIVSYLQHILSLANTDSRPYEFFSALLQRPCPADPAGGLHAVTGRMGAEALDPLEEFLSVALAFEDDNIPTLQNFLLKFCQSDTEIKRTQEEAGGRVRIMTVHGAKGLQAPIVFLPDTVRTTRNPPGSSDQRLIWPDKSGLAAPLWSPRKDSDCRLYAQALTALEQRMDEEYRRLLYVAMTRAEDRLYVCGHTGRKAPLPDNWHEYVRRGLSTMPGITRAAFPATGPEAEKLCLRDTAVTASVQPAALTPKPMPIPAAGSWDWLRKQAVEERPLMHPVSPSRAGGGAADDRVFSPRTAADSYRFERGNITHKLLQYLPSVAAENRVRAAEDYVARHGSIFPPEVRAGIVQETLAVLSHPAFAPLFGAGSLAEVPVAGTVVGVNVSGQIDRLLVTDSEVWIADYKTNRPSPPDENTVPVAHITQMKYYSDIVANIYTSRRVRCFLLWTDTLRLMEIGV
jgi:ATP-dependent helicase/nuclease subunit A